MIHTFVVIVWVVLATLVFGIAAIATSLISRTGDPVHRIAALWAKSILFVSRIDVTIRGISNIDPSQSFIYMSNHQSNFDIPVLLACLPVQFRWLAKAELFRIPIFGRGMRGAGYISIDRFNQESAFASIGVAAKKIEEGASVMIFPEGTRSIDGNIRPFKKGGFVLAVDSGVPIVPVILHGTWKIMPKNQFFIEPGHVVVEIKRPIESSDYTRETKDLLMGKIRNVIMESFEKGKKGTSLC